MSTIAIVSELLDQFYEGKINHRVLRKVLNHLEYNDIILCSKTLPEVLVLRFSVPIASKLNKGKFRKYSELLVPLINVSIQNVESVILDLIGSKLVDLKHGDEFIKLGTTAIVGMSRQFEPIKQFFSNKGIFDKIRDATLPAVYSSIVTYYFTLNQFNIYRIAKEAIHMDQIIFDLFRGSGIFNTIINLELSKSSQDALSSWALDSSINLHRIKSSQYFDRIIESALRSSELSETEFINIACCVPHTRIIEICGDMKLYGLFSDIVKENIESDFVIAFRVLHAYLESTKKDKLLLHSIIRNPKFTVCSELINFCSYLLLL